MFKITILFLLIRNIIAITNVEVKQQENENYYTKYINRDEESARVFLQRYSSLNPVVLLVENTQQSHNAALNYIKSVHKLNPRVQNIQFLLMKFNSSENTQTNKTHFENLLKEKILSKPSTFLGHESNGSAVFFAILNAAHLLPPNSGIVIFMKRDTYTEDESLAHLAFLELKKKLIQVFVFWRNKRKNKLLEEVAANSRGVFLTQKDTNEENFEEFLENISAFTSVSMILSRRNLRGENNLVFPIDPEVTGIHISVIPVDTRGVLTTPRGYNIDISGSDDVVGYSVGSFIKREDGVHEIHINTTTAPTQDVGVWRLRVSNARALYNITVFAHTGLTAKINQTVNTTGNKKIVKVGVTGDVSSISNISFVNKDGNPILSNVKFTLDKDWENHLTEHIDHPENTKKELKIDVDKVPKDSFYAVIDGKDSKGHSFRRLSYVRGGEKDIFYLPPITIDVGLGSELITQPFRQPQLYFEVTNNGNTPTLVRFYCRDEKGILLSMDPWYKWINPQETATVRVTLTTRSGQYQDFITFTASGTETTTKKVTVDVGLSHEDRRDPYIDYHFTSDCTGVLLGSCEDGTWTVEVTAKDTGSGLLQVISRPKGIYFPNGFTTGTTEEVTGFFSESCCNPDLELVAFDRLNNRRTKHLNAYRANLGPGAIAAIVLGVLLLILIIVALFFLFRKCCIAWRNKESYDLPVYRGPLSSRRT